jgi:hypothetical protein
MQQTLADADSKQEYSVAMATSVGASLDRSFSSWTATNLHTVVMACMSQAMAVHAQGLRMHAVELCKSHALDQSRHRLSSSGLPGLHRALPRACATNLESQVASCNPCLQHLPDVASWQCQTLGDHIVRPSAVFHVCTRSCDKIIDASCH